MRKHAAISPGEAADIDHRLGHALRGGPSQGRVIEHHSVWPWPKIAFPRVTRIMTVMDRLPRGWPAPVLRSSRPAGAPTSRARGW
jgi:hypothetical protein